MNKQQANAAADALITGAKRESPNVLSEPQEAASRRYMLLISVAAAIGYLGAEFFAGLGFLGAFSFGVIAAIAICLRVLTSKRRAP